MARDESDREDLLREATALVERIELVLLTFPRPVPVRDRERDFETTSADSSAENIVIGFRAGGAVSMFFGAGPVYQYNAAGDLRRAYCDGLLFKASRRRLVSLERVRRQNEVQLLRRDLTDAEQDAFVAKVRAQMNAVADALMRGNYKVVGQVPAEADVLGRVREWLAAHEELPIAATPRV